MRFSGAVAGGWRSTSDNSSTLKCRKQAFSRPFIRALQKLVPCFPCGDAAAKSNVPSVVKVGNGSAEKSLAEFPYAHLVHKGGSPPVSLTRLETIEEREEEYI